MVDQRRRDPNIEDFLKTLFVCVELCAHSFEEIDCAARVDSSLHAAACADIDPP